jgi:[ribosomal protein S5]-alanine N-acetyltransferase
VSKLDNLQSPRLVLEAVSVAHAEEMYEGLRDPALYEFIPEDPPVDLPALARRYGVLARGQSADGTQLWLNWFLRPREGGPCIGYVQATVKPSTRHGFVAYLLLRRAWGQGHAREALGVAVEHLFERYALTYVDALIDTRNLRSIRLVESLGFARVELIAKADHFKGADSDEVRYRRAAP